MRKLLYLLTFSLFMIFTSSPMWADDSLEDVLVDDCAGGCDNACEGLAVYGVGGDYDDNNDNDNDYDDSYKSV